MSSRKALPRELSPSALQDIEDILRYTGETWGEAQLTLYEAKIDAALRALGRDPDVEHARSDLPTTHRADLVGAHVIVYQALPNRRDATRIGIVRVLHQRMSLPGHV